MYRFAAYTLTASHGRTAFGGLLLCCLLGSAAWAAQPNATPAPTREPGQTLEPKVERITHEDAGSRIEELRIGGQTRRIDVHTKSALPSYQVQPIDPAQTDPATSGEGRSSWRVLQF